MIPIADSIKTRIFPLFNLVIIGINLYVFYLMLTADSIEAFVNSYALIPSMVNFTNSESLIPFITSMFLHGGLLHIGSNMLFLWVFGDNIEAHFGKLWYLMIYFVSGVVGGLSQYILSPDSVIPMLGASGAVSGILGAYYVSHPHAKVKSLVFILFFITILKVPASIYILYWFGLQVLSGVVSLGGTGDVGGVAFWAHVGGFMSGVILAKIGNKKYEDGVIEGEYEEV